MTNSSDEVTTVDIHQPMVLVVLLNYNNWNDTQAALESVLKITYSNYRVFLIDNASADNSVDELRKLAFGKVELLESPVNTGFAGGCNLGIERAVHLGAEYVWLLNNDAITPPDTLSSLISLAQSDTRIGLVSPVIVSRDAEATPIFAGGYFDRTLRVYEHTESIAIAREWVKERPYAATVFGTAMLVPIKLIREIGMFDESLFMYYEDLDLSVRSGRAGYRNLVDWSSVVYHDNKKKHRNPQEMKPHYWYYNARNSLRFWRRYLGLRRGLRIMWWEFNTYIRYWNLCRSNRTTGNAILAGLWHGCLDRGGAYDPEYVAPSLFIGVARRISRRKILQVSQSAI